MGKLEAEFSHLPEPAGPGLFGRGIERILQHSNFRYPDNFTQKVRELAKDGNSFVIATNHMSHADAFPAAQIGYNVMWNVNPYVDSDHQINGFLMPFAQSMNTGGQGRLLDVLFKDTRYVLDRLKTEPVFTATENDVMQKRVDGKNSEEFMRNMRNGIKQGKGIIVFPEGKVEGGRRDEEGKLKGMQEFTQGALYLALRFSLLKKGKVTVIPAGISGGYNVYDPHKKSFTRITRESLLVGFGFSSKALFNVNVGEPIVFDKETVRQILPESVDSIVGIAIGKLLPEEERGRVYRPSPSF